MTDSMIAIPWATDGWNEIIPNLYQGGQIREGSSLAEQLVRVTDEFDAVYSFYIDDYGCGPGETTWHTWMPFPDGPLHEGVLYSVKTTAMLVATEVRNGQRTLVRCHAGYSRSGLVVALTLMELGHGAQESIDLIREKRSPWALCNRHFVDYILGGQHD